MAKTPRVKLDKTASSPAGSEKQTFHLDDALGFLFRRLSSFADSVFINATGQSQLTPMQMGALLMVNDFKHLSLRELARRMHVDRSTIQELIKRMENKGLVRSRASTQDRRTYELWLTALGRELLSRYLPCVTTTQELLLKDLKPAESRRFIAYLRKILAQGDY